MGQVIDLMARADPIKWHIIAGCPYGGGDSIQCDYVGDDEDFQGAQWAILVRASAIDHVQGLIEAAKIQLARCIATNAVHSECVQVGHKTKAAEIGGGKGML